MDKTITLDGIAYPVPDFTRPKRASVGATYTVVVPFSEAAMAAGIAGQVHDVRLISDRQAMLMRGSRTYGGTYLPCEIGFYRDSEGFHYYGPTT